MITMARKGQFKKGGGRVGGGTRSKSKARRASTAIVVVPSARKPARQAPARVHHKPKRRHHRGGGGGGALTYGKVGAAAIVLANVAGTNNGPLGSKVYDLVQKIPGAKTFGGASVAGLVCGGLGMTRIAPRSWKPWLKAAGFVGVVAALLKVGEQGTNLKWLGGVVNGGGSDSYMDVR